MKILNAYAGIGGNRKLWGDEHQVTAIELNPDIAKIYQSFFPNDTVIVGDAHKYMLEHFTEFDFIWSSPPCPTHSKARYGLGFHGGKVDAMYPDMKLYQEIILLQHHFKGKYCIENVMAYYKPLIEPQMVGRHWYWANFLIPKIKVEPSRISQQSKKYMEKNIGGSRIGALRSFNITEFQEKLGFDLSQFKISDKRLLLRNCVEPEIGLHIISQLTPQQRESKFLN